MVTRRHFLALSGSLFSASLSSPAFAKTWPTKAEKAAWDAQITPANYDPATTNPWGLHPRLLPQRVLANDGLRPGDIHVDAIARYLYHIEEGGTAMRYGVAIAKGDLYEPGTYTIRRKGSRALYLFVGDRDTYLRIHGTPSPRSIGGRASSGCVRMVMAHINDLYPNVAVGSTAFLYSAEDSVTARS